MGGNLVYQEAAPRENIHKPWGRRACPVEHLAQTSRIDGDDGATRSRACRGEEVDLNLLHADRVGHSFAVIAGCLVDRCLIHGRVRVESAGWVW